MTRLLVSHATGVLCGGFMALLVPPEATASIALGTWGIVSVHLFTMLPREEDNE